MDDYKKYCPDNNVEEFDQCARALIETLIEFRVSPQSKQGYAKGVQRNLSQLRNALKKALQCKDTTAVIHGRQIDKLTAGKDTSATFADPEAYGIAIGNLGILNQLNELLDSDYTERKLDSRRSAVAIVASSLWQKHGGTITTSQGNNEKLFTSFLERVCMDAGLDFDAVRLTRDFLK